MGKRILLIEDEAFVRDLYFDVLSGAGYDVTSAIDGEDAIAKAEGQSFDLILLDVMLPKLTGMEVLKRFRDEISDKKDTPIYLLTNLGEETVAKEAYKLGADGYLLKAKYLPKELINEVNKFFVKSGPSVDLTPENPITSVNNVESAPEVQNN